MPAPVTTTTRRLFATAWEIWYSVFREELVSRVDLEDEAALRSSVTVIVEVGLVGGWGKVGRKWPDSWKVDQTSQGGIVGNAKHRRAISHT